MKKYLVSELWGSLFNDDLQFEAKNKQQAIKQYFIFRNLKDVKAVYDSLKNNIQDSSRCICVQEGHYENSIKWIKGKRGYYKIIAK